MTVKLNPLQKDVLPIPDYIIADTTEPNTPTHNDTDNTHNTVTQRQESDTPNKPVLKRQSSLTLLFKRITNLQIFTARWSKPIQPRPPQPHISVPKATPLKRTKSNDGQTIECKEEWLRDEEYISEDEYKLIHELREKLGDYIQHMNDKLLMIFLLARHMNIDDTIVLLKRHIEWRNNEINLPNTVQFNDLNKELVNCGLTYWTHANVFGETRVVQYFKPAALKFNGSFTIPELVQYLMWGYELSTRLFPLSRFRLGFIHVIDLASIGRSNIPGTSQLKQLRKLMSDHFPMRLRYVYLIHCNWFTSILLRCAALVLKDRLMERIHKIHIEELAHIVPVQHIPEQMEGEWKFSYQHWLRNEVKQDEQYQQKHKKQLNNESDDAESSETTDNDNKQSTSEQATGTNNTEHKGSKLADKIKSKLSNN